MTRIVILGCAGSGKSRLATRLGAHLGAPVISLDALWRPFAARCDIEAFRETVIREHAGPSWISDGNFADVTFDIRLPRAQKILFVDRRRGVCALRSVKRLFHRNSTHHPRELRTVLAFIASFDRSGWPMIETMRRAHGPDVPVDYLDTDRACEEFLARHGAADKPEVSNAAIARGLNFSAGSSAS
jgi:hypothetical protein